jgi:hypothetical protein
MRGQTTENSAEKIVTTGLDFRSRAFGTFARGNVVGFSAAGPAGVRKVWRLFCCDRLKNSDKLIDARMESSFPRVCGGRFPNVRLLMFRFCRSIQELFL